MIVLARKNEHGEVSVSVPDDADMAALMDAFKTFSLALGYHPNTVDEYFGEER